MRKYGKHDIDIVKWDEYAYFSTLSSCISEAKEERKMHFELNNKS